MIRHNTNPDRSKFGSTTTPLLVHWIHPGWERNSCRRRRTLRQQKITNNFTIIGIWNVRTLYIIIHIEEPTHELGRYGRWHWEDKMERQKMKAVSYGVAACHIYQWWQRPKTTKVCMKHEHPGEYTLSTNSFWRTIWHTADGKTRNQFRQTDLKFQQNAGP